MLLGGLIPKGFLIEGEANDDGFDSCSFLIDLLIFFKLLWRFALQLDITEKAIFGDDDIEVVFLHAEDSHLHDHVALQGLRSLLEEVEEYLSVLHDSLWLSCAPEPAHKLTLHQFLVK